MKFKPIHLFIPLFLTWLLLLVACDAPRRNPYDPANPDSPFGALTGHVKTLSVPHRPVANVSVRWQNGNRFLSTDATGSFRIANLRPDNGWLYFEKENYLPDSVYVEWNDDKNVSVEVFLNARPSLDSVTSYSIVLNRYPDWQYYQAIIQARISDKDNDMDSVYIRNSYNNIRKPLIYNVSAGHYEGTFTVYDLNLKSIDEIVGHDFDIFVKDKFGHTIRVGEAGIKRVIHQEVQFKSPANYQQVSRTPELTWKAFDPGFPFYFTLQVYTDEISPQLVWEKTNIPSANTAYTVDTELPVNDYFWVIWCVDEFQNRSRSKPASFTVR